MKITLTIDPAQNFGQMVQDLRQEISQQAADAEGLANPHMITIWHAGISLLEGQLVRRRGQIFRVMQTHTVRADWLPGHTPEFYQEVISGIGDSYEAWLAGKLYSAGDRVSHLGRSWESAIDNNHWEPAAAGVDARIWKEIVG
jgi:hypothetical protein